MVALLEQIYREQDWKTDPNKAVERASHLRDDLGSNPSLRDEFKIREVLAENLMKAGDSAGAIEQLEKVRAISKEDGIVLAPGFDKLLRDNLAMAYLRQGEQENDFRPLPDGHQRADILGANLDFLLKVQRRETVIEG